MQCWSAQKNYAPIPVASTRGCWIHTTDGQRIFDLRSAHECINLGFNHPRVLQAMREQMEQVIYVTDDFATAPTAALAEKLAFLSPGGPNKKVFFSQSGASAVEAAIKAARFYQYNALFREPAREPGRATDAPGQYPYPYKIISRYRSWHGSSAAAASASGDPRRWFQEPFTVPGMVFAPDAGDYRSPWGTGPQAVQSNLDYLEYLIEQEGGNNKVAAVILEPVVGSNGIIPPPEGYLPGVRRLCDKWGLLLIADETMTGLGRTGRLFALEHYGVEPDILVLGKALGAYCPLAATIFSERVSRSFDENIFGHGQSYSGHALACAAGLASLEVLLEPDFLPEVRRKGEYLGERLRALAPRHPCVGDVRGLGMFWTIEMVRDQAAKTPLRKATEKYQPTIVSDLARHLLETENIYVPSDKFGLWIVPPLIVTHEEIDWLITALDKALTRADAALAIRG